MPALQIYIPFLVIPFLFPSLNPVIRLLAMLLASGLGIWYWISHDSGDQTFEGSTLYQAIRDLIPWLILGSLASLYFVPQNLIFTYRLWPVCIAGLFLICATNGTPKDRLGGFSLSILLLWQLVILVSFSSFLFPGPKMAVEINSLFSFPDNILGIPADPIIPPSFVHASLLFHAAMLAVTTFVFMVAFWPFSRTLWLLKQLPLYIWGLFLLFFNTHNAVFLLGIMLILFILLCEREWLFEQSNHFLVILIPLVLMGLESFGWISYLIQWIPNPITGLEWDSSFLYTLHLSAPKNHPLFAMTSAFSNSANIIAGIPLLFLVAVTIYQSTKDKNIAPLSAGCISILMFIFIYCHYSALATISHPLTWLAAMIGYPSPSQQTIAFPNVNFDFIQWHWRKKALALSFLLLFLLSGYNLFHEWRAEASLRRLIYIPSMEDVNNLYSSYAYRPDIAATYSTFAFQYYVSHNDVPNQDQLIEIEKALFTSIRFDYIPLLALKRYSDLYYSIPNGKRSTQMLEYAISRFPKNYPLHLLLAQQYETLGKWKEAQKYYQICINLDPASPDLRKKLALIYKKEGRDSKYQQQLDYLHNLDPSAE